MQESHKTIGKDTIFYFLSLIYLFVGTHYLFRRTTVSLSSVRSPTKENVHTDDYFHYAKIIVSIDS